jgi:hypothetical protein
MVKRRMSAVCTTLFLFGYADCNEKKQFTSFIMELAIHRAIDEVWPWHFHVKKQAL